MKVRFLGVTQEMYRATTDKPPIKTLQVSRGAVIDLPEERVKKLKRDYPEDWEVFESPSSAAVSEPTKAVEAEEQKGDESPWTRKRAAKK